MRVLLVNKFLRLVGGTETVFFNEWQWLEEAGHEVIPFGMAHAANIASPYRHFWVAETDYHHPQLRHLATLFWSQEAAEKLAALIKVSPPDVAHLHNIYHQLSPSVVQVLAEANIPTLLTIHDYKLVCPNYRLYTQGQVCTRCVAGTPLSAFVHRCLKDSWLVSGLGALETTFHRWKKVYGQVGQFIAPSQFAKKMMVQGGWAEEKVTVLPHALPKVEMPASTRTNEPFILYAGRLVAEKGVWLFVEAARKLPDIPFRMVGSGQLQEKIEQNCPPNLRLLGQMPATALAQQYAQARAVVIPSLWYEIFGMVALEAMGHGVPVIASDIGGLPEVVEHGQTGWLFPAGDVAALVAAISKLWHDSQLAQQLGMAAQERVKTAFVPAQHLTQLLTLFQKAKLETL